MGTDRPLPARHHGGLLTLDGGSGHPLVDTQSFRRQSASYELPPDPVEIRQCLRAPTIAPAAQSSSPLCMAEKSSRLLVGITHQGREVRPPVDGLGERVALFIECPLAHLVSTHCFVEGPGREIGAQDADAEP